MTPHERFIPSDGPNRVPLEQIADDVVRDLSNPDSNHAYRDALQNLDLLTISDLQELALLLASRATSAGQGAKR